MVEVPRIGFDALPPELRDLLAPRVKRLGYLGEFFQVGAHQPEALGHFIRFTETLKEALPANLVELCALTVSTWSGNDYERVQHERLSLKLGLTKAWIRDVERLEPETATKLTTVEQYAQLLVVAVITTGGRNARRQADTFLQLTDAQTLIGILLTIGRYLAHSAVCNTLQITAPVSSPLTDES
jgi:alkylhydroperoxidase family enzyme